MAFCVTIVSCCGYCQTYGNRYSVSVSSDGECCLDITDVRQSDAGLFTCIEESATFDAFLVVAGKR